MPIWVKFWLSLVAAITGPTATIALIVIGLPGTVGDAMTWIGNWLPTVGQFIANHASVLTPAWLLSLAGITFLGWLHLPEMRSRRAHKPAVANSRSSIDEHSPTASVAAEQSAILPSYAFPRKAEAPHDFESRQLLTTFISTKFVPALLIYQEIVDHLIRLSCGKSEIVADMAMQGQDRYLPLGTFHEIRRRLIKAVDSGTITNFTKQQLVSDIASLRMSFLGYLSVAEKLAEQSGNHIKKDNALDQLHNTWITRHAEMSAQYAYIARDTRMGELYRPNEREPWGRSGPLF